MDPSEFARLVDRTFDGLAGKIDALDRDDLDAEMGEGKLVIEHGSGTKLIVSRQAATAQIWLAEPGGGWHYGYVGGRWVCDKRGVTLIESLEKLLSKITGEEIRLG